MTCEAITRAQFAERYGVSLRTVHNLMRRGEVKWYRIGRKVRILPIDEKAEAEKRAK